MRHLCIGPLVGQGNALAHLGGIGLRRRRLGVGAGNRQPQQHRVASRLAFKQGQCLRWALLFDQEVGIGQRGIRVGFELQHGLKRGVGRSGVAGALLQLGQARQQPGLGRRRSVALHGKQAGEGRASTVHLAAQGGIFGQAGIGMQRSAGGRNLLACGVRLGVSPLHTAHGRKREPGLRTRLGRRAREQALQARSGGIEFMQILLQHGAHHQHRIRHGGLISPASNGRHGQAHEARVTKLMRLIEVALRDTECELRIARLLSQLLAQAALFGAAAGGGRKNLDDLVVTGWADGGGLGGHGGQAQRQSEQSQGREHRGVRLVSNRGTGGPGSAGPPVAFLNVMT